MTSQWRRDNGDDPADLPTHFPHFFKIIMPQTLREGKLRIPKKFISEYGVHLSDMAFLMIPNGTKWKVKLTKRDGEVCFENGWCEFASCHALTLGHLLVFRYEGNSEFSVLIFDATVIEIDYPAAELQVRRMEDNESDDNSLEIMNGFVPSRKTGEKPPVPLPYKRAKTNPSSSKLEAGDTHFRPELTTSEGSMLEKSKMLFRVSFTRGEISGSAYGVGGEAKNLVRANALKSENPHFTVTIHPSYINGKDRASLPHGIINYLSSEGFTKDYTKGIIFTVKLEVVDRLWPVKLYVYEGKYSTCVVSAGWSAFERDNTLRVGDDGIKYERSGKISLNGSTSFTIDNMYHISFRIREQESVL